MIVSTLIDRAARRYSSSVALEGPDGTRTFAEVGARSAQLAHALLAAGLRPGDRVLDLQTNSCTYVESDFGITAAGLCRVALNHRLKPADWTRIAEDCGARALIYNARFTEDIAELAQALRYSLVIGGDGPGDHWKTTLDRFPQNFPRVDIQTDDLISLNYSSGTTGRPKGAERTHRNRFASLTNIVTDILRGPPARDDAWCHAAPITHASGLFVLPHFVSGTRQVILSGWEPEALIEAVQVRGATGVVLVPTMLSRLLASPMTTPGALAKLRRLAYAGAPMPANQVREVLDRVTVNLIQFYGLVEAIPPITVLDSADHLSGRDQSPHLLTSAGRPCLGVELRVVDDVGESLPPGEIGEVITRGDHVMRGYFASADSSKDELSTKTLVDGWLHTGDLGHLDSDNRLYLTDRKGDMIISGGYNIFPREVEDVIAEIDGVEEVAVIGVSDTEWERVVAYYRPARNAQLTPDLIMEHCANRLPGFKKPKEIHSIEKFPLSSTGKIEKKALRQSPQTNQPRS